MVKARAMIAHILFGILLFFEGLSKRESCHRRVLYVDEITQHSAVLYWRSERESDSKVVCAGIRQYVTQSGSPEVDLDTVTQFVAHGVDRVLLNHLQPNFNYSCLVLAKEKTRPLLFSTQYAAPEPPEPPAVLYGNDGTQIDIQLFPTSTKNGPIDGYEIQFHVIDSRATHSHGQLELPEELTKPGGELLASVGEAATSPHPLSFSLVFKNSLPNSITTGSGVLEGVFHSGTTYCVVTAAYTGNTQQESEQSLLYSLSPPSETFSLIITPGNGHLLVESPGALHWIQRHLFHWSIIVGVVSSNIILLYFLLVGCCVVRLGKRKWPKNNQYKPVVNLEDECLISETPKEENAVMVDDESLINDCDNTAYFKEPSLGRIEDTPMCSTNEKVCEPEIVADRSFTTGEAQATAEDGEKENSSADIPPLSSLPQPQIDPAHGGKETERDRSGGKDPGIEIKEEPIMSERGMNDELDVPLEEGWPPVEGSGSSLVFVPRGLSHAPLSQSISAPVAAADMAPDLEMDLYGISYSLDEPQDY